MGSYKQTIPLEERKSEVKKIFEEYPDRLPVIVEKGNDSPNLADLDKKKYLVPKDLTVGQFLYVIRKRLNIDSKQSIYIFVNNVLPPTSQMMTKVYDEHKDPDGFLYITYHSERTFG